MRRDGKNFAFIVVMHHPPSLQHCRLVFIGLSSSFIASFSEISSYDTSYLPTSNSPLFQLLHCQFKTPSLRPSTFEPSLIPSTYPTISDPHLSNGVNSLIRVIHTDNNISKFKVSSSIKSDGQWCSDHYHF